MIANFVIIDYQYTWHTERIGNDIRKLQRREHLHVGDISMGKQFNISFSKRAERAERAAECAQPPGPFKTVLKEDQLR
jgi:hypothetical protein